VGFQKILGNISDLSAVSSYQLDLILIFSIERRCYELAPARAFGRTAFYNEQSVGYTPVGCYGSAGQFSISINQSLINPHGAYYTVTGQNATVNSAAAKVTVVSVSGESSYVIHKRGRDVGFHFNYDEMKVS
jgi:hypothetical protein